MWLACGLCVMYDLSWVKYDLSWVKYDAPWVMYDADKSYPQPLLCREPQHSCCEGCCIDYGGCGLSTLATKIDDKNDRDRKLCPRLVFREVGH